MTPVDALGGIDLSRDRPDLLCLFHASRHGMARHQRMIRPYKIGILLDGNFRPRAAIFIPASQKMRCRNYGASSNSESYLLLLSSVGRSQFPSSFCSKT
jgi:hypothetical protein